VFHLYLKKGTCKNISGCYFSGNTIVSNWLLYNTKALSKSVFAMEVNSCYGKTMVVMEVDGCNEKTFFAMESPSLPWAVTD
jgi:hypothetical protein